MVRIAAEKDIVFIYTHNWLHAMDILINIYIAIGNDIAIDNWGCTALKQM